MLLRLHIVAGVDRFRIDRNSIFCTELAAPDRAVWASERGKYSGFYYNISNSVFFYSVRVINILYGPSEPGRELNTMSILTFEDCSSRHEALSPMLQWFLCNGINFIWHVAHWHVIQRHVPANYKAVTTQMTEEIFVSTFIIGKRIGGNKIRITKKKWVQWNLWLWGWESVVSATLVISWLSK